MPHQRRLGSTSVALRQLSMTFRRVYTRFRPAFYDYFGTFDTTVPVTCFPCIPNTSFRTRPLHPFLNNSSLRQMYYCCWIKVPSHIMPTFQSESLPFPGKVRVNCVLLGLGCNMSHQSHKTTLLHIRSWSFTIKCEVASSHSKLNGLPALSAGSTRASNPTRHFRYREYCFQQDSSLCPAFSIRKWNLHASYFPCMDLFLIS